MNSWTRPMPGCAISTRSRTTRLISMTAATIFASQRRRPTSSRPEPVRLDAAPLGERSLPHATRRPVASDREFQSGYARPVAPVSYSPLAGGEGTWPVDFVPWQRGVTCTVRPEWLAPIDASRTYLANVTVQRAAPLHEPFTDYGSLYNHAMTIVRSHQLDRAGVA